MTIDLTTINQKAYDFIRLRIIDLTYPPGHKLNLVHLREELGVSQTPIKDALSKLVAEGLLEISSRRGTFVRSVTQREIADIFQTRLFLESGAAEAVARHITDEECTVLEGLWKEKLVASLDAEEEISKLDVKDLIESDYEFHQSIVRFTKNEVLLNLYKQLNDRMQVVRFLYLTKRKKTVAQIVRGHQEILQAFRKRDPVQARQAVIRHLEQGKGAFLDKNLAQSESSS